MLVMELSLCCDKALSEEEWLQIDNSLDASCLNVNENAACFMLLDALQNLVDLLKVMMIPFTSVLNQNLQIWLAEEASLFLFSG